ncbi:MAG: YraN family protein [Bryobacteraceae bacterium]|nr:YraN family protein [Bryobacteraceae bacterium]MCX7604653.1 YraN family protein [Bryobacteraceae bacterium]
MWLRGLSRLCDELRHWARSRRSADHLALGRRAEDLAHRYLEAEGLTVVDRNWTLPDRGAEVDLVAWDGDTIVFVEVKSRRDASFADPLRAIDREKRRRVARAAQIFLRRWRIPPERARFDVVTVVFEPYQIRHYRDAWSLRDRDRLS